MGSTLRSGPDRSGMMGWQDGLLTYERTRVGSHYPTLTCSASTRQTPYREEE